ncbi:hypothetical protein IMCC1989_1137 [gamma proteobacterium IMCC1989]|nr:hypothetical protein IMCC1989_1137 [gamma proteobacterium IMCC1989]
MKAPDFLQQAQSEMFDRATTYDNPEGERSMANTVAMFNALTGHKLTEEQGWKFMVCLKLVRSEQGAFKADNFVDGAAYFGLAGETAASVQHGDAKADAVEIIDAKVTHEEYK